jgi:hypothetical protein
MFIFRRPVIVFHTRQAYRDKFFIQFMYWQIRLPMSIIDKSYSIQSIHHFTYCQIRFSDIQHWPIIFPIYIDKSDSYRYSVWTNHRPYWRNRCSDIQQWCHYPSNWKFRIPGIQYWQIRFLLYPIPYIFNHPWQIRDLLNRISTINPIKLTNKISSFA